MGAASVMENRQNVLTLSLAKPVAWRTGGVALSGVPVSMMMALANESHGREQAALGDTLFIERGHLGLCGDDV